MAGVAASKSTWANANNACNNKPSEGGKAWRLPTRKELVLAASEPGAGRLNNANSPYWSSELGTGAGYEGAAWFVDVFADVAFTNYVAVNTTYVSGKCVRALSTN
ncbi:MAG: DUF1566 domain-containing protein [Candidatus Symbiothrix sp.]|jgi:hypothetical protein|nr:DUF1566 domain-containing protein [Candidatus Symbiothrix sp.]